MLLLVKPSLRGLVYWLFLGAVPAVQASCPYILADHAIVGFGESEEDLSEAWGALGRTFEHLPPCFEEKICYASEINFLACVEAIQSILNFDRPAVTDAPNRRFVPLSYQRRHHLPLEGPGPIGPACLTTFPSDPADNGFTELRRYRRERRELYRDWLRVFRKGTERVDFKSLADLLKGETFFKTKEPQIYGAVMNALTTVLEDPHTMLYPFSEPDQLYASQAESFVGVGITFYEREIGPQKQIEILKVFENSPAHVAGIQTTDVVVAIDGTPVSGLGIDQVRALIGETDPDSSRLEVRRGGEHLTFQLNRAPIPVPAAFASTFDESIGYIALRDFSGLGPDGVEEPCAEVKREIEGLVAKGVSSLILDLRFNRGGFLTEAACVAELFLDLKPGEPSVLYRSYQAEEPSYALPDVGAGSKFLTKLPLIVLINPDSASGAELVAGALQDYARAFIIGERSFGKGTAQGYFSTVDGLLFKQTIGRFFLPSGRSTLIAGVRPDIVRYAVPHPTPEDKIALRESDLYAIPPQRPRKRWKQPRPDVIARLEDCMERTGSAFTENNTHEGDFQIHSAIDAAHCLEKESIWNFDAPRPTYELGFFT